MLAGFTYSRVVIIQSLELAEVATGRIISEHLIGLRQQTNDERPIDIINCDCAHHFLEIIEQLTHTANSGDIPLLHVECHGDPTDGLEFANGSTLAWDRVANALLPLNIASRFNLLAIFSACFGAHFLSQMDTIGPAPCWCLIAPTKKVDPGEILGGFRVFYSALFKDADMGSAVRAISRCQLSHGEWLWEPAEIWYQRIVTGYIKVHCTESAARERARTIYKDAKKDGKRTSLGSILRIMKKKNRDAFTGDYFDRFFIIDIIPENNIRFAKTKERVANTLATLRNIGKYAI